MSSSNEAPTLLSFGIFQYELTNCMLNLLEARANSFLRKLHNLCEQYNGPDRVHENYVLGLEQIKGWGEDVISQEMDALKQECPEIETVYAAIVQKFMAEYFRGFPHKGNQSVYVPSFGKFVKTFYLCLANDDAVRNMEIFKLYSVNRKFVFVNAFRQTLCDILKEPISLLLRDMPSSTKTPRTGLGAGVQTPKKLDAPTPNPRSVFNDYVDNAIHAVETPKSSNSENTLEIPSSTNSNNISSRKPKHYKSPSHNDRSSKIDGPRTLPTSFHHSPNVSKEALQRSRDQPPSSKTPGSTRKILLKTPSSSSRRDDSRSLRDDEESDSLEDRE